MNSFTTGRFRACLTRLPEQIQKRSLRTYRVFQKDPNHPSLHFKHVHATKTVFSASVGPGAETGRLGTPDRLFAPLDGKELAWELVGHQEAHYLCRLGHMKSSGMGPTTEEPVSPPGSTS